MFNESCSRDCDKSNGDEVSNQFSSPVLILFDGSIDPIPCLLDKKSEPKLSDERLKLRN